VSEAVVSSGRRREVGEGVTPTPVSGRRPPARPLTALHHHQQSTPTNSVQHDWSVNQVHNMARQNNDRPPAR